jgi:dihydrofolate reductase
MLHRNCLKKLLRRKETQVSSVFHIVVANSKASVCFEKSLSCQIHIFHNKQFIMAILSSFNFISLDGYYKGPNEDISWAPHDAEGQQLSKDGLSSGNTLLFGRVTYQMMQSFWTSALAVQRMPEVAAGMNNAEKLVFSDSLKEATWQNTRILNGNLRDEILKLKQESSNDITILGSGNLLAQCAEHNLIDLYQVLIHPVAIGAGTPIFNGLAHRLNLKLTYNRVFKSGAVLLHYAG